MDSSSTASILTAAAAQIVSSKYTLLGSYSVVLYDYFLTLNDEVNLMWTKRFSLINLLFFINRYYALCVFTLEIIENMSDFNISRCAHYVKVQPLGEGIPFTFLPNIVIGLRVYALYGRNKWIGISLATYFVAELGVALWIYLFPSLHPVPLPAAAPSDTIPVLHLCLATVSTSLSQLQAAAFQFMQTIYDSTVFGLILYKTLKDARGNHGTETLRTIIAKHGLVYYVVVFTTNFTWAMMIIFSPPGLRYACAAPTLMLACVSVNRLTLSLRGFSEREAEQLRTQNKGLAFPKEPRLRRRRSWIGTSTFEIGSGPSDDTLDFNSCMLYTRDTKVGDVTEV